LHCGFQPGLCRLGVPGGHALPEQRDVLVVRHGSISARCSRGWTFHTQIAYEPLEASLVAVVLFPAGKVSDVALATEQASPTFQDTAPTRRGKDVTDARIYGNEPDAQEPRNDIRPGSGDSPQRRTLSLA
jgi:hypothetical protein